MLPANIGPPVVYHSVVIGIVLTSLLAPSIMAQTAELQVLQGNGAFTNKLYQALSEKPGNVFFSPISAHAVLSMAYQGAQGTTAQAFSSSLNVPEAKTTAEGYNQVLGRLNNVENVTLLMANRVYLKTGYELLEDFKSAVTKQFLSEVQQLEFAKSAEAARTINTWVEQQTKDRIKDLISPDDLDELTRLVLVNAIYFKGNWKNQFKKEATKKQPFWLNDNDSVEVDMMHTKQSFRYKNDQELDAQIVELPYQNPDLSMIIILPNKRNGIGELEAKLKNVDLSNITQQMWSSEVNLALPKFKLEQTIDMKESLTKVGLGEIFDDSKANFRGMIPLKPNENLYVSKVVQKAFIEVNEEGAEAAAATGMVMMMRCSMGGPRVPVFNADHPFIYLLAEKNQGTNVLFGGRLAKPDSA